MKDWNLTMRKALWIFWVLLKWRFGKSGPRCQHCGFHEASHYNYDLEYDHDEYPCTYEGKTFLKKES